MNGYVPVEKALSQVWKIIDKLDWGDNSFCLSKAYVCGVFSEAVYSHLPLFELKNVKRVAIIPCFRYAEILAAGESVHIIDLFRAAGIRELSELREGGDFFTIVTKYAVVLGVKTPKVIIVSIRGTNNLWDFLVDFHAAVYQFRYDSQSARFHRGFFLAAARCIGPLMKELQKYSLSGLPIYLTGHSLGGAMAAIVNILLPRAIISRRPSYTNTLKNLNITSAISPKCCYTLGMPRFGGTGAVSLRETPFRIFNIGDGIPHLPPRVWYKTAPDARCIDHIPMRPGCEEIERAYFLREILAFPHIVIPDPLLYHSSETYRKRLRNRVPEWFSNLLV